MLSSSLPTSFRSSLTDRTKANGSSSSNNNNRTNHMETTPLLDTSTLLPPWRPSSSASASISSSPTPPAQPGIYSTPMSDTLANDLTPRMGQPQRSSSNKSILKKNVPAPPLPPPPDSSGMFANGHCYNVPIKGDSSNSGEEETSRKEDDDDRKYSNGVENHHHHHDDDDDDDELVTHDKRRSRMIHGRHQRRRDSGKPPTKTVAGQKVELILHALVYAGVNIIIAVPGLYGYSAVIFNHAVFHPYRNALAKLVLFSSCVHQLGFLLFSSLSGFAIGTVQDAGLIFLSSMANTIANRMILQQQQVQEQQGDDSVTDEEIEQRNVQAIVSTTVVLLSGGTALLGFCLVIIGKLQLANVVAYLPMPVVGGYLAFIGYFCVQAGVALAISTPLISFWDWQYVWQTPQNLLLAAPALLAGFVLLLASRYQSRPHHDSSNAKETDGDNKKTTEESDTTSSSTSSALLPLSMVAIPVLFYIVTYTHYLCTANNGDRDDSFLDEARRHGWVGPVAPPTPVSDLLKLVHWDSVEWSLVGNILWTWVGMVFVVSFASCLDVAAISMDMGEPLDTNRELKTVGLCNVMSGLTFGFTGSYIFSQTIFTYRTGVHTRWIGIFIMVLYLYFVVSPLNLLQISPLFFLGSTLIFIGYDLLYEWFVEIRQRVLWSEYAMIWGTFLAIQMVGVDAGILVGVVSAMVEHAISNAQDATTVSFVPKRSKAIWTKEEYDYLHSSVYHVRAPQIITLEITGPIFFGSSLAVMDRLREEVSLDVLPDEDDGDDTKSNNSNRSPFMAIQNSPRTSSSFLTMNKRPSFFRQDGHQHQNNVNRTSTIVSGDAAASKNNTLSQPSSSSPRRRPPPKYCVLDLTQVSNVDASSARSCFYQFCKACHKQGITVCSSGATPRIAWMLRTHDAAYPLEEEEERIKAQFQAMAMTTTPNTSSQMNNPAAVTDRILLFHTTHEALEFCEASLIHQFHYETALANNANSSSVTPRTPFSFYSRQLSWGNDVNLSTVLSRFLVGFFTTGNLSQEEIETILNRLNTQRYHSELTYNTGEKIMAQDTRPESFYVVLEGAVASGVASSQSIHRHRKPIMSGAGPVNMGQSTSFTNLMDAMPSSFYGGSSSRSEELDGSTTNTLSGTTGSIGKRFGSRIMGSIGRNTNHNITESAMAAVGYRPVIGTVWPVGGVFGYTDLLLDRPRTFAAFATQNQTRVARITRSNLNLLYQEDAELTGLLHQVLMRAGILDLANCTCHRV